MLDPDVAPPLSTTAVAARPAPFWRRALPWSLAGVLGAGLVVALWQWAHWRVAPAPALVRLSVEIGADASLAGNSSADAILSPDGQTLAFVAVPKSGGPKRIDSETLMGAGAVLMNSASVLTPGCAAAVPSTAGICDRECR